MELAKIQDWAREHFGERTQELTLDYGVARLLVQAGQLGEAVLQQGKDLDKEIVDVLLVLVAVANRCGIDLEVSVQRYLYERSPREILARISGSSEPA